MNPSNPTPNDTNPTPEPAAYPITQFQPASPPPVQSQGPAPVSVPQEPPRKSRKGLIALLVSIFVVIALVVAAIVTYLNLNANANAAAAEYKDGVIAHIDTLLTAETPKARAEAFNEKVQLKSVPLGDTLSANYKAAKVFDSSYQAFIEKAGPIMRQRYATLDLSPFLREAASALDSDVKTDMPEITNTASATQVVATITSLKEKGEAYVKLADRFNAYEYEEKYVPAQKAYAETLRAMGTSWLQLASVQAGVADKQIEIIDAAGDTQKAARLTSELGVMVASGQQKMNDIVAQYPKDLSTKMWALVNAIADDQYIQSLAKQAGALQEDAQKLKQDAESLKGE